MAKHLLQNRDLLFSVLCGLFLFTYWIISRVYPDGLYSEYVLYFSYFFGGYYTTIEVWKSLRKGKFNIDLLMLIAAIGAAIIDAWAEGALLLFLFSLGHALEHLAMNRAKNAIKSLSDLAPDTALLLDGDKATVVSVESLVPGNTVRVKPGERFPADGFVIAGSSSVNQAPITGESIPVDKVAVQRDAVNQNESIIHRKEHRIFAGTVNGDGLIDMQVISTATESTIGRVVTLIKEAEKHKSPTQRFATNFEKWFVPAVLIFVAIISFAFLVLDETFEISFYRAMTVLVAASPCALAISTPSAILSGIARSAQLGILIKGGEPLEQLGLVRMIAFDKTGTITKGEPRITDIKPFHDYTETDVLRMAASLEQHSDHPLAKAIVADTLRKIQTSDIPTSNNINSIQGHGLKGLVLNLPTEIGKAALFADELPEVFKETDEKLKSEGRTTVIIRHDGQFIGIIGLMDTPRAEASQTMTKLKALGIQQLVLLSGDHQFVADSIAKEIGLNEAIGDLLPDQKLKALQKYVVTWKHVAMVGDGINDGPALAAASVGIAMGAAGSDVALETADIALMADDLSKLPTAISLSRATRSIIKQNIYISLGMIAFLVPAALTGFAGIGLAVFLHEGSTIAVVLNALRLLGWKES